MKELIPKTIIYKDVLELNAILNKCVNKGLAVDVILKLVDLKDSLSIQIERYQKVFKELMSSYDIKEERGVYNWSDHTKVNEISDKVNQLIETSVVCEELNCMEGDSYITITDGFNISEIQFVKKFLKKK